MNDAAPAVDPTRVFLATPEAAQYLTVAPRSLASRRWREARGIPAYKLGPRLLRFDRAELDQWLEQRRSRSAA